VTDELCFLPARTLASMVRKREVSATELLDAHLARIEQQAALGAVVSLDVERARSLARACDASLAKDDSPRPLEGVPITLKDAHEVEGLRTTIGTPSFDHVAERDGTVASRLRAAGAIAIGHSNVPPFLADHQSANSIFGRTSNPWDLERTAGGSSGGAAAAVAAGLTSLEVGSDMAGSTRLPAAFTGVYGLKTTEHRVPMTGFFEIPNGPPRSVRIVSTLGPIARDLDDLALALGIIAGPDGADSDVPPVPLPAIGRRAPTEIRLAVATTLPTLTIAKRIRDEVSRVASAASNAGVAIEERLPADLDWPAMHALFGEIVGTITGIFDPSAEISDEHRGLAWYLSALERRERFLAVWESFFEDVDALLLPGSMVTAFEHDESHAPIAVDGKKVPHHELAAVHVFANFTGLPALALPAGRDEQGLPIGVQLVGPKWSEAKLLEIARALEEADALPGYSRPR
jgi:amidase